MNKTDIITYYQSSQWLYRLFIYDANSLGMHFGFWEKETKDRQEAILNENKSIITHGGIKKSMRVLDAGCGVGGTAIYIAKHTGALVCGITLDSQQVALAHHYAKKRDLSHLIEFSTQDYTHTNFPDNYFDVVYGIESICYSSPKSHFLKEAYRILKPNGKLVIADGYLTRKASSDKEKQTIKDFCDAFVMPEFITENNMNTQIKDCGFIAIKHEDMTMKTLPTVIFFDKLSRITSVACRVAKYIPSKFTKAMFSNYLAMKSTKILYDMDIFTYQVHSAVKPAPSVA